MVKLLPVSSLHLVSLRFHIVKYIYNRVPKLGRMCLYITYVLFW